MPVFAGYLRRVEGSDLAPTNPTSVRGAQLNRRNATIYTLQIFEPAS
jgi:hypothetical protein